MKIHSPENRQNSRTNDREKDERRDLYTVKVYFYAGGLVPLKFSMVKQYVWVSNTGMRDLPLLSVYFLTYARGYFTRF